MSSRPATRVLRVRGTPAELESALDRLYLGATVLGVVEGEGRFEAAIEGAPPDLGPVDVEWLPAGGAEVTGLEQDRCIEVGASILVRPPWVPPPLGFTGIELAVPRAMAFGSGEHGSTQAALLAMDRAWSPGIGSAADVGTGSGILALYAVRRGCPRVLACDVDPVAVAAATELVPEAEVHLGGPEALPGPADLLVANMRSAEILACLDRILGRWTRRGPLILSGLRAEETAGMAEAVGLPAAQSIEVAGFTAMSWRGRTADPAAPDRILPGREP